MLTCPNCNKNMHPVCGRKDCVCNTRIPAGELPMKNLDLFFGKIKSYSTKFNRLAWHITWYLNIGYWLDKLSWRFKKKLTHFSKYLGFSPFQFIFELQECPYCGYANGYDFWEDRSITQTFPDGNWDNPID